jgi:mono/diheme cytochrome c family protein
MFSRLCLLPAAAGLLFAQDNLQRGKYLVEEVAKCQMCHTARDESGEYVKDKWLKGAPLDFTPTKEVKGWHKAAPDLTSTSRLFTRWKEEGLVNFLVTGKGPSGNKAGPPMPTYNLTKEDARAVVDYLKSLK